MTLPLTVRISSRADLWHVMDAKGKRVALFSSHADAMDYAAWRNAIQTKRPAT